MSRHQMIAGAWAVVGVPALLVAAGCARRDEAPTAETSAGRLGGAPGTPPAPSPDAVAARPPAAKKEGRDDFGQWACRLMKGCYAKHGAYGQVSGRVAIRVDAKGKATAATYDDGTAPGPVKDCIASSGKQIDIPDFDAGAGELVCEFSGQLMAGGMERLTKRWKFVPAP